MRTVAIGEVAQEAMGELPECVREALGELAGAAKEGLLALSVGVGLGVLHEILEAEVDEVVGPKGKHNPDRAAVRHGHENGLVTLGGRRVPVSRPRMRSADDERELALSTYRHFADRDALTAVVLERMLAGVSTRRYERTGEPVGADVDELARSTSKSAVSREFVARTRETLIALMSRPLGDLSIIDSIGFVLDRVRQSRASIPRRCRVSVSSKRSRSDAAAPGWVRPSSLAKTPRRSSAAAWSVSFQALGGGA
jgi:putative transposase